MKIKKKIFVWFLTIVIIFAVPITLTYWVKSLVSLYNFSPLEAPADTLKKHITKHLWIFSLLNLAQDIPYYHIAPNAEDVGPAVEYLSPGGEVVGTVPFDSLSCLADEIDSYNAEKVSGLNDIDWTNCKFIKDFGWGYTSTEKYKPKIDITLGTTGIFIILPAIFVLWNGFILLLISVLKKIFGILSKWFKI